MTTPVELEKEYQEIKNKLPLLFSSRNKISLIIKFFSLQVKNKMEFVSYALELLPVLSQIIQIADFNNTETSFFENNIFVLKKLKSELQLDKIDKEIEIAIDILEMNQSMISEMLLKKKIEKINYISKQSLRSLLKNNLEGYSISIPLIENEPFIVLNAALFGVTSVLTVTVKPDFSKSHHFEKRQNIVFPNIISDEKSIRHYENLFDTAKNIFVKLVQIKLDGFFTVNCSLGKSNLIMGESIDAGFILLILCELFRIYDKKNVYKPNSNLAITGRIDKDGRLALVEGNGLKQKIEACIYSNIKVLVVPKVQYDDASEIIRIMAQDDALTIIGIDDIKDCLYDRRIIETTRIPASIITGKKIWAKRRLITIVLFVMLIGIIAKMIYGPIDKYPYSIDYEEKYLQVRNKFNEILYATELGESEVINANYLRGKNINFAELYDADGDNYKDLIFIKKNLDNVSAVFSIICYSIHKDKLIWEFLPVTNVVFPHNPVNSSFFASQLKIGDFDKDGIDEVYIPTRNSLFPSVLYKLNARTGKEIEYYLHIGHISDMRFVDINNDGTKKMFICGVNQAYKSAFLAVLNPGNIKGHSPTKGKYIVKDMSEANELKYLIIPQTIVGEAVRDISSYGMATEISQYESEKLLRVTIQDADLDSNLKPTYDIFFDYSTEPIKINTNSSFDVFSNNLGEQGKLKTLPDQSYFTQFLNKITWLK